MNQYKVSRFAYYIGIPAMQFFSAVARFFQSVTRRVTGRWWCEGCGKYHPGRIYAFSLDDFLSDGVCGLHLEKQYIEKYHFNRGGRKLSAREMKRLQETVNSDSGGIL